MVTIRRAVSGDANRIGALCASLWPDGSAEEHTAEAADSLHSGTGGTLPLAYFLAESGDGAPCGFVQVGLRSHADGCDPHLPIGFIEGWFVLQEHRARGVGAALIRAAEQWARDQGCREMASDTWIDNEPSQCAHEALGYEVVDRCVHYRKPLY